MTLATAVHSLSCTPNVLVPLSPPPQCAVYYTREGPKRRLSRGVPLLHGLYPTLSSALPASLKAPRRATIKQERRSKHYITGSFKRDYLAAWQPRVSSKAIIRSCAVLSAHNTFPQLSGEAFERGKLLNLLRLLSGLWKRWTCPPTSSPASPQICPAASVS